MNQPTRKSRRPARPRRGNLSRMLSRLARQRPKAEPWPRIPCDNEMMSPQIARVLGPYANGKRWRLVVFEGDARKAMLTDTREEAEQIKAKLLAAFLDLSSMTIGAALDEYFAEKRRAGLKEDSVQTAKRKICPFLPADWTLGQMTPQKAAQLYQAETQRQGRFGLVRAATHHKVLRGTKAFFAWVVERGYLTANPFANIKSVGRASAGKRQLRQDEARKLNELLIRHAEQGEESALAVLVQLVMGLRSGEVLGLRVRDLDAGGTVLVVEGTKTKNARRELGIESEPLRELLSRHCAGRPPAALIFGSERAAPYHTDFLFKRLRRYCQDAGVPVVCPHSLRGLHSSLAVARGASSRFVAEALGHGSDTITKRHYIQPGAIERASVKRVAAALSSKPTPPPNLDTLADALRSLTPDQLEALLSSVGARR